MFRIQQELSAQQQAQWNAFLKKTKNTPINQSLEWAEFQKSLPHRECLFTFYQEKNEIVGICLLVRMPLFKNKFYWYYSARGPIVKSEYKEIFTKNIIHALKKTKAIFWKTETNTTLTTGAKTPYYFQPQDTLCIDLHKPEVTILAEMKRKGRYNIKLAEKKGITIKIIHPKDITCQHIDIFYNLLQETTQRDSFSGHNKKYYEQMLAQMKNQSVLAFAYYQNNPIATAICTHIGDTFTYYYGASTSDQQYRNLMAPYLLQWELIKYAKQKKYKWYDFLGIAPENQPNHRYNKITVFKTKFGGNRITTLPPKDISLRPLLFILYRTLKALW